MNKLLDFLNKHNRKLLWLGIVLYIIIFSLISLWKYNHYLYNSLDLGIINNVFFNLANGQGLWSSIQGHSYLGDHFTPIIFLLLPIYYLWQSPITLLILQSIFLGLTAWPIYLISNKILSNKVLALVFASLWLINPLAHNINLFEYHWLSILPFAFLGLFYLYLKIKDNPQPGAKLLLCFCVLMLLCLMIREDIFFIIFVFLILTIIDNQKNRKMFIVCCLLLITSIAYFLISSKIISANSPSSFSPFLYYYSWLGGSVGEIIQNIFLKFGLVLKHILTLPNLEMITGLLLPFLFIPILKPKYLLITLLPLGQILLSAPGGGALVWQMHYGAFFLPGLILAFIYGFAKFNPRIGKKMQSEYLLVLILVVSNIYLGFNLGPWGKVELNKTKITNLIGEEDSVVAGFQFLSNLSSRTNIYSLHYFVLRKQQFDQGEYKITEEPKYIIASHNDLLSLELQLKNLSWAKKYYQKSALEKALKEYGIKEMNDNYILWEKDLKSDKKYNFDDLNNLQGHLEMGKMRISKIVLD